MSLDDLVNISISASTASPTKPGFGTILIAAQKVPAAFTSRSRLFASLTEMTDFGFSVSDPAYLCAQKMKAQNPTITNFKVGKRTNKVTQTLKLKCKSAVQGDVYLLNVGALQLTYTVLSSATTTTVATAIAALIIGQGTVTTSTDTITITQTAASGTLIDVNSWSTNLEFTDATPDPGLAADLAAIKAFDNDWYGLALDSNSEAEIDVAALFVETEKKLFVPNSSDFGCEDSNNSTDVMSDIKAAAYARTGVLYSRSQLLSYSGAAWMAKQFTQAPGSDTWKFKTLASVTVDTLSASGRSTILGKNGNCYTATSGINMTEDGKSGSGEWLDTTRFVDWQRAELQFRLFSALVNNSKIPYTDAGIDYCGAIIKGGLEAGEDVGGLVPGSSSVTVPKAASIPSATRQTRKVTGITFKGTLQGAIHALDITGTVTA